MAALFVLSTFLTLSKTETSIQDIAFYLRAYKFNQWDAESIFDNATIPFYSYFPDPPLTSLHWEVQKYCSISIYICIVYLHDKITMMPLKRDEDYTTISNQHPDEILHPDILKRCIDNLIKEMKNPYPFDDHQDRYQWTTTALYYMCWYTMKEEPLLKHLEERCDNYATCHDPKYDFKNMDVRADDSYPFNCAMYSFCPDPCCPMKHVSNKQQCLKYEFNPCYLEGNHHLSACTLERFYNTDFEDLILNNWNASCDCVEAGFVWDYKFDMCVDENECLLGSHKCNLTSQNCINLPGTYDCFCNVGYQWNTYNNECTPIVFEQVHKTAYNKYKLLLLVVEFVLKRLFDWF